MKTELCTKISPEEKDPACPKCGERLDVYSNGHGRTIIDCSACCHAVVDPDPWFNRMCNICLAGGFCRPYIDYIPGN